MGKKHQARRDLFGFARLCDDAVCEVKHDAADNSGCKILHAERGCREIQVHEEHADQECPEGDHDCAGFHRKKYVCNNVIKTV